MPTCVDCGAYGSIHELDTHKCLVTKAKPEIKQVMTLADRIRQLHTENERLNPDPTWREINDLSNEELIDLISQVGDEWIDTKHRAYDTKSVMIDNDFDN